MHYKIEVESILTKAERQLSDAICPSIVTLSLRDGLRALKSSLTGDQWNHVIEIVQASTTFQLFQQDPICYRAHTRPRGYSGDADLLDMIYRRDHRGIHSAHISEVGESMFSAIASCNAPTAVRNRAAMTADKIDSVLTKKMDAEMLSVASGHLEELNRSRRWGLSPGARMTAFDQDSVSLKATRKRFPEDRVECVQGDVKRLLSRALVPGPFDLIYSTGLFDYLSDRFAARLIAALANRLNAGGTLIVFNFHPGMIDDAFMDTIMDWRLIYRDPAALLGIAKEALTNQPHFDISVSADAAENLAILEVRRSWPP